MSQTQKAQWNRVGRKLERRGGLRWGVAAVGAVVLAGSSVSCVRRELQIHSDPPGALVYLNDQEIGRTPVTRPFTFYGTYDVVLRKEGYETLKTKKLVLAPWWQWVPFDLAAELFPLTDRQRVSFKMNAAATQAVDPAEMFLRSNELRDRLPSTQGTGGGAGGGATTAPAGPGQAR